MAVASPGWRTLLRERMPLVTVEWSQSRGESEVLPSKSLVGFLIQGSRWANRIRGTGSSVRPGRDEGSQLGEAQWGAGALDSVGLNPSCLPGCFVHAALVCFT